MRVLEPCPEDLCLQAICHQAHSGSKLASISQAAVPPQRLEELSGDSHIFCADFRIRHVVSEPRKVIYKCFGLRMNKLNSLRGWKISPILMPKKAAPDVHFLISDLLDGAQVVTRILILLWFPFTYIYLALNNRSIILNIFIKVRTGIWNTLKSFVILYKFNEISVKFLL